MSDGLGFGDPVTSGVFLLIPAIRSPNYSPGVAGWTINRDGSAEFNNLNIRGTFTGSNYVINSSGEFFYNGTPATGNLIVSVTAGGGGTDSHGNAYQGPGVFFYSTSGDGGYIGLTKTNTGQPVILLGNTAAGASPAFIELTTNELAIGWAGNGGQIQLTSGNPGVTTLSSPVFANGGTPAVPTLILTDSWNAFSLVGATVAGTDVNGTSYPPAYTLLPDGRVALRGVVTAGAGGLASGTTWAVIPAAYRPVTNIPVALVSNSTHGTLAHVYVRPNGNMQFNTALGAGVSMWIDCTLNVQGT